MTPLPKGHWRLHPPGPAHSRYTLGSFFSSAAWPSGRASSVPLSSGPREGGENGKCLIHSLSL